MRFALFEITPSAQRTGLLSELVILAFAETSHAAVNYIPIFYGDLPGLAERGQKEWKLGIELTQKALSDIHSKFIGTKLQSAWILFPFGNYRQVTGTENCYSNSHFTWLGLQETVLTDEGPAESYMFQGEEVKLHKIKNRQRVSKCNRAAGWGTVEREERRRGKKSNSEHGGHVFGRSFTYFCFDYTNEKI